jgi:hypothetical protein
MLADCTLADCASAAIALRPARSVPIIAIRL